MSVVIVMPKHERNKPDTRTPEQREQDRLLDEQTRKKIDAELREFPFSA